MGLTFPQISLLLYNLFVNYVFGSMELTMLGLFVILAYISWKMHVTADGWVLILGGFFAIAGWVFIPSSGIVVLVGIGMGIAIYFLLRRLR